MKAIAELKEKYGTVTFEGVEYILTQEAYFWSACENKCAASAIREDELDENGIPENFYIVFWDILDDFEADEYHDFEDACDWEHPIEVMEA